MLRDWNKQYGREPREEDKEGGEEGDEK